MSMAMGYAMNKKGRKCMAHGTDGCEMCMADGGEAGDHGHKYVDPDTFKLPSRAERAKNEAAAVARRKAKEKADMEASRRRMDPVYKAEGGEVDDDDLDMVGRIMRKRGSMDSDPMPMADSESADFDYMDEMPLDHDADDTGANSGDERGDAEQDDERDIAARILKKRAKPKMPSPA